MRWRGQVLNVLEHINDDASSIPRRELSQLLYGRGSVYSRRPTPKQIQNLKMQDLKDFLARWERPDNTIFGISGEQPFYHHELTMCSMECLF